MAAPVHLSTHQFTEHTFQGTYATAHGSADVTPAGYVYNVTVNPKERGQGHGTELMNHITGEADRMGKGLVLHARDDLHPWYNKLGFEVAGKDTMGTRLERLPKRT